MIVNVLVWAEPNGSAQLVSIALDSKSQKHRRHHSAVGAPLGGENVWMIYWFMRVHGRRDILATWRGIPATMGPFLRSDDSSERDMLYIWDNL